MWMANRDNNNESVNANNLFVEQNLELDSLMRKQQKEEITSGVNLEKETKAKVRKQARNDKFSSAMYKSKKF